jgi:flagellin-like hook-associated protein FlgL
VKAGDLIVGNTYNNASGTAIVNNLSANDIFSFSVKTTAGTVSSGNVTLSATTSWQDVVDQINQTAAVNTYIKAEFDSNTGQLKISSLSDAVQNVKTTVTAGATVATRTFDIGLGDPTGKLDQPATFVNAQLVEKSITFNSSTQALDQYANDFNTVRSQIDALVKDASYRGVNLLNGDNLTTFFNEDNTNKLVTSGKTFTADGLGLVKANFSSASSIDNFQSLTKAALTTVRSFGSSLSNNLSIIQTRQDFTKETVNTLKAGASELTDADLNEEGATLLALQTAQQLGVTALSLASQSQQSVLRLF